MITPENDKTRASARVSSRRDGTPGHARAHSRGCPNRDLMHTAHVAAAQNTHRMIDKYVPRLSDLHGFARLGVDATSGVTDLVEAMHAAIARPDLGIRSAAPNRTTGIARLVYRSVRGVTGLAGNVIDTVLAREDAVYERTSTQREAIVAALNGVLGDHLAATRNPLALPMRLHHAGKPLTLQRSALSEDIPHRTGKLLILVHGLCMNDLQWTRDGHDHGAMLDDALDYTSLYLNYNTGLSVAGNGQRFARLLERLLQQWPEPVDEITLIGHSMGGLVARSACHHAEALDHVWRRSLRNLVCMGSPHHGAPLERGGNWIDLVLGATPFAAPLARIGKIRSAGITDLRHGYDRTVPLPKGVRSYTIAATTGQRRGDLRDRWIGDGLVPVASALGHHPDPDRAVVFAKSRQWIGYDMNHLDLLNHPDVADRLLSWLSRPHTRHSSRKD
jgi:pimeloyl-ACP methyl ester carboxylesterase